jgi:hypothetical protein
MVGAWCTALCQAQALSPADLEGLQARKDRLIQLVSAAQLSYDLGRKTAMYDLLAGTARMGCGHPNWQDKVADYTGLANNPDPQDPIEIFGLPPLVRYLYQFGHCLSAEQNARVLKGLERPHRLFSHGTLNHAALQGTSWYLLAQYFPQATWQDMDGPKYSSEQLMALLKPLLVARSRSFYRFGHIEQLSPTYAVVNLFPILNLADFAADPQMRAVGENEALLEVALLKAHSFHGVIVPPLTRKNAEQHNGPDQPPTYAPSVSQHVLWYYFGEPAQVPNHEFRSGREPCYAVMLALSNWRPPRQLYEWAAHLQKGYRIQVVTPQFAGWEKPSTTPHIFGDAFISDAYALSVGNVMFDPAGYEEHIQTFGLTYKSDDTQNQIACYHPYFNSNLGEDAWSTDRWSPFQQSHLIDEHSAVLLFDIPAKDPWGPIARNNHLDKRNQHFNALLQVFQCRVSSQIDQVVVEGPAVYLQEGGLWMALVGLAGEPQASSSLAALLDDFRTFKWRQPKGAVYVQVAAGPMGLAAFKASVAQALPKLDLAQMVVSLPAATLARTGVSQVVFVPPSSDNRPGVRPSIPTLIGGREGLVLERAVTPIVSNVIMLDRGVLTLRGQTQDLRSQAGVP